MALIKISHLTFGYDGSGENVFTDVSFQVDTAWKLGFCGRNGRGKTTFLKLLLGEYEYSGSILSNERFDYFPYPVANPAEITADIVAAAAPAARLWEIRKEFAKLLLSEDVLYRPFETLSGGERTKALLAGLFLRGHNYLLIDEPTDHLDSEGRAAVAEYLNRKSGFILVSHDRAFLDACVDHILSVGKADIEVMAGNFSVWQEQKRRREAFERTQSERLAGEIGRLKTAAARAADWSHKVEQSKYARGSGGEAPCDRGYIGHKAAKMMKRSQAAAKRRQTAIDEKAALLQNAETAEALKLTPLRYHAEKLVAFDDVSLSYGKKRVCQNVSFTLRQGERTALQGGNGAGKSSILRLITGERIAAAGRIHVGSGLKISYVPQDTAFLTGSPRDYARRLGVDLTLFFTILRKFDFPREQLEKDLRDFSAGQKKKALIAASLCERAHLYVWDEPLNYIDLYSRMQIEELILTYRPTLLFVEHDRAFRDNIATETITL
ncbi:MAG: ABC-F type ribosomal protection protein [Gracilibacteraceae bacterium]|nr:ABC-F type ribosomal protection protein [Gracilibacteraceae bacterium]